MASTYSKTLLGCLLIFVLVTGMKPQTPAPGASNQAHRCASSGGPGPDNEQSVARRFMNRPPYSRVLPAWWWLTW